MRYSLVEIEKLESKDDWIKEIQSFLQHWRDANDFITAQTSGSTGKPKQINLLKSAMVKSAENTISHFNITPGSSALLCMPAAFIGGKMMMVRAMVGNWDLSYIKPSAEVDMQNKNYDFVAMTPHQVVNSLHRFGASNFKQVKTLLIGGGEIPVSNLKNIQNLPCDVYSTYGMTETISHVAVKHITKNETSYQALPNIQFDIDNRNCLIIHANYLNTPIITNDVVTLLDNHSFEWLGRYDNVVNSGGIKIHPEKLEKQIAEWYSDSFFLHGVPHHVLGQQLIMVVDETMPLEFIKQELRKTLPKKMVPKQIWRVTTFVNTATDKINRIETLKRVKEKIVL